RGPGDTTQTMARALLRLVHSLERRRHGTPFVARLELSVPAPGGDAGRVLSAVEREDHQPRAFVIGAGDRVDLAAPGGLLPRHVAVVAVPGPEGVLLRAISLHPDRVLITHAEGHDGVA